MSAVLPNPHDNHVKFSCINSSWVQSFTTSEIDFVWSFKQKFPINTLRSLYGYHLFLNSQTVLHSDTSSLHMTYQPISGSMVCYSFLSVPYE